MGQVSFKRITKTFGDLKALDSITFDIAEGSIHAVLGENGAGKSTLMNILYGFYQPDSGKLLLNGLLVHIDNPRQAIKHGIGMVHQHFMIVDTLTVTENIVLGIEGQGTRLKLRDHAESIRHMGQYYGFEVDPLRRVADLPIGMQQRVEILKALYREAKILIFDEPTSVLTPIEVESFLEGMKQLREKGCTIIFITHKLAEVMAVADSVTVLRHGRVVAQRPCKETNVNELARLMVERDVLVNVRRAVRDPGNVVLKLNNVSAKTDGGALALDNISLELCEGEILGVAGVDGNGQSELAEVITGLRPIDTGTIQASGTEIAKLSLEKRRWQFGIGFVPPDRQRTGLVLEYSAPFNLALRRFNHLPFSKNGILDFRFIRQKAVELIEKYDVRLHDLSIPVRSLSGGNQQKLILAREIEAHPKILVAMQACKGLDIGATEFVQNKLAEERDKGLGVLYISTELEHILEIADRIAVMFEGRITGILPPEQATPERIGMLMAGVREEVATC